jgi:DNA-binding LacI/PurR family transcriptional regulator
MPFLSSAFADRGRRIAEDLSVITICPDDLVPTSGTGYTNIHVPTQELGEISVDMVMGLLEGNESVQTRLLAPVLTRRLTLNPP